MVSESPTPPVPSLEELIQRHLGMVTAYVRQNLDPSLRAKESVADVVQSVCRELLDRGDEIEFSDEVAFRTYFCRTALRKVIDRRRYYMTAKRDVAREVALQTGDTGGPPSMEEQTDALDRFEASFARLSAEYQEVITLRRVMGYDSAETARRLGVSEGEIRRRLARALTRLAAVMGE